MNTDDYEGHTPGPWSVGHEGQHDLPKGDIPINWKLGGLIVIAYDKADARLIAAAPELLAEVKRLREALITVQRLLTWDEKDREMDGDPVTLEALVEQVEWVRSNIMEMIE